MECCEWLIHGYVYRTHKIVFFFSSATLFCPSTSPLRRRLNRDYCFIIIVIENGNQQEKRLESMEGKVYPYSVDRRDGKQIIDWDRMPCGRFTRFYFHFLRSHSVRLRSDRILMLCIDALARASVDARLWSFLYRQPSSVRLVLAISLHQHMWPADEPKRA